MELPGLHRSQFGRLDKEPDGDIIHGVADRLIGQLADYIQCLLQGQVIDRRVDSDRNCPRIHRRSDRGGHIQRRTRRGAAARIIQEVDADVFKVIGDGNLLQGAQHFGQRQALFQTVRQFRQLDLAQLAHDDLTARAGVNIQVRGERVAGMGQFGRCGGKQPHPLDRFQFGLGVPLPGARVIDIAGLLEQVQIIRRRRVGGINGQGLQKHCLRLVQPSHFVKQFAVLHHRRHGHIGGLEGGNQLENTRIREKARPGSRVQINFLLEDLQFFIRGVVLEGDLDLVGGGGHLTNFHVGAGQDFPRLVQTGQGGLLLGVHFGIVHLDIGEIGDGIQVILGGVEDLIALLGRIGRL